MSASVHPRGRISCLCDLPLTFAFTDREDDPIDLMWIMMFCTLP